MNNKTTLIGICGRTASGKSSIAREIHSRLATNGLRVGLLRMDDFYRTLTPIEHNTALQGEYDFDNISAFDMDAFREQLQRARNAESIHIYHYDHSLHQHTSELHIEPPAQVWVVEGLYLFADKAVADMFDLKIFMEVDPDTSLMRRIRRDCVERGRTVESVLSQYERYVKPAYDQLVEPFRHRADITILRGAQNYPALDTVINYIRNIS